jgi:hypothetical protein
VAAIPVVVAGGFDLRDPGVVVVRGHRLSPDREQPSSPLAVVWDEGLFAKVDYLMSGHIYTTGFASQARLRKQKNGRQKNGD